MSASGRSASEQFEALVGEALGGSEVISIVAISSRLNGACMQVTD